jgi:lipid-A-disaccharide synthase
MEPDRAAARLALGLDPTAPLVAILPGSRRSEIDHLAERFIKAAALMKSMRPGMRFVIPVVPGFGPAIEALVQSNGLGDCVTVLKGQSHSALAACDVTLIASGTATLEAALFKRPMVIAYHQNWLSWQIMRRKRLQPWVGLPNILCTEFVVPELLQDEAAPAALAAETIAWLDAPIQNPERLQSLQTKFAALHRDLLRDTATIATDAIQKILET